MEISKLKTTLTDYLALSSNKNIIMFVGNKVEGDSRVLKSAEGLINNGFNVVLFGIDTITENFKHKIINKTNVIIINNFQLGPSDTFDSHFEKTENITNIINTILEELKFNFLYTHDFIGLDIGSKVLLNNYISRKIFWIHDVHEYIKGYESVLPIQRFNYAIEVEKRNIGIPDQLIVVNEKISNLINQKYNLYFNNNLIVYNTPRKQNTSSYSLRDNLKLKSNEIIGVYLGRATSLRGLDIIINSLKYNKKLHYVLFSENCTNYLDDLKTKAIKINVEDRLHILDYIDDKEIVSVIKECSFGLSPLKKYGNSDLAIATKICDYIHAELPILGSDVSFQKEFIELNNIGEIFESENEESYNKKLKLLINRINNQEKFQFNNLKELYNWETQFEKIVLLLRTKSENFIFPQRGIFNGPGSSAGQPGALSSNLRKLGINSQSINISLPPRLGHKTDIIWPSMNYKLMSAFTLWAIDRFDVFHLHFRPLIYSIIDKTTLNRKEKFQFPTFQDLSLIKQSNKKLIFQFRGSEIRINNDFKRLNPFAWSESEDPSGFPDKMKYMLRNIVNEFADLVLVTDPELQTYVPNSRILQRSIEIDEFPYIGCTNKEKPLIVHAPTRRKIKGSEDIINTITKLQDEGQSFNFELLENMEHSKLMEKLKSADIIIDQIRIGWYGVLSVESMALGKTVFAYIRDDIYDSEIPIVNVNKHTLEEKLKEYINDYSLRKKTGEESRKFIEEYHNSDIVALKAKMFYDNTKIKKAIGTEYFKYSISDVIEKNQKIINLSKLKKHNVTLENKIKALKKANNTVAIVSKKKILDKPYKKIPARLFRRLFNKPIIRKV